MRKKMTALCLLALLFSCLPALAQEACLTKAEAQAITFSWTDAAGVTHQNNLAETAKDPRHIIALLKEVYTNPNVPGPYYNGYKADGTTRENEVYYGSIYGTTKVGSGDNASYNDVATGWDITSCTKPYNEGYTMLLVAVKNGFTDEANTGRAKDYDELVTFIGNRIDSVFVITDGLRMNGGTMFSIKGTYNRFFYLSKGKSRVNNKYSNTKNGAAPFYRMFEEFSPYEEGDIHNDVTDFYNLMIRGESMPIEHDCNSVFGLKHYFSMSGRQGQTAYDMTGLNLFIPDHRMQYWTTEKYQVEYKEGNSWKKTSNKLPLDARAAHPTIAANIVHLNANISSPEFIANGKTTIPASWYDATFTNYNPNFPVKTFMYAIKLRAERSAQPTEENGKHLFTVTLNWNSTFSEATGSDMAQKYYLYRVVNGAREATPIATFTDELTWSEQVEQHSQGYMVSYVVLGKPEAASYDPIPSNIASVAIPGDDPEERLALDISGKHESVFDAVEQINKYANYVVLNNGIGNSITRAMLAGGDTQLKLHRIDQGAEVADAVVATLTITAVNESSCTYTLAYDHQDHAVEAKYGQNYQSGTFNFDTNGDVKFNNLTLCDQFSASTLLNDHQSDYKYQMTIEGLTLGAFKDKNGNDCDHAHSNEADVFVYKTVHTLLPNGYTQAQVDTDITNDGSLAEVKPGVTMDFTTDNDPDVLYYHMYRNAGVSGSQAQRDNSGAVNAHNNDGTTSTWLPDQNAQLTDVPATAGVYNYVPVIETYRGDGSAEHNTYGADRKSATVTRIDARVLKMIMSEDKFEDKGQSNEPCRYYATGLELNPQLPAGVTPRFVRVWHKLPDGYAHEWKARGSEYAFRLDQTRRCVLYEKDNDDNDQEKGEAIGTPDAPDVPLYMGQSFPIIVWDQFGALDIEADDVEPFEVEYVIRVYCTKDGVTTAQGAPRRAAGEAEWVIAEKRMTTTYTPAGVVTSVYNVKAEPAVTAVRYVNLAGQVSTRPWMGINVVVTTMADGTTRTTKEVR